MSAEIIPISSKAEEAWASYVAAQERAQKSLRFEDGKDAAVAWRRFLELYLPDRLKGVVR